jgi:hypothetical protein
MLQTPLPFVRVEPAEDEKFRTCVPLVSPHMAAGGFSKSQEGGGTKLRDCREWVRYGQRTFEEGMFVATARGRSMDPKISDGSHCLFRKPPTSTRQGQLLVVQHRKISDPQHGGHYTLKCHESEKVAEAETGEWLHTPNRLKPLTPDFDAIEVEANEEDVFRVVAEFVEGLQ